MRHALNITLLPALATFLSSISLSTLAAIPATFAFADAIPLEPVLSPFGNELPNISKELFFELEELARLVDIAYCVGSAGTGVYKPFECISRCSDFEGFELVTTWNTGPLLSDSCGYIALDHTKNRIVTAFRGTYSISNTIVDLITTPQEYVPYPGDPDDPDSRQGSAPPKKSLWDVFRRPWRSLRDHFFADQEPNGWEELVSIDYGDDEVNNLLLEERLRKQKRWAAEPSKREPKCQNCTVHAGFLKSWLSTRDAILPHILKSHIDYPDYSIHLVGHSLGGAVAALAGLELEIKGLHPTITTFGEPRIGNAALRSYLDTIFSLSNGEELDGKRFRRVTHKSDPVPLLPLTEWKYAMHAGEVYISKKHLSPEVTDIHHCSGDEDLQCIASGDPSLHPPHEEPAPFSAEMRSLTSDASTINVLKEIAALNLSQVEENAFASTGVGYAAMNWGLSERMKLWELFFAHRDYFWRLGLCVPGGDPRDWFRRPYETEKGVDDERREDDGDEEDERERETVTEMEEL